MTPPEHLRPATAAWWSSVQRDFKLDEHHVRLLTLAAEVTYIADQLGHGPDLSVRTYQHTFAELEDRPQLPAEDAIREARRLVSGADVPQTYPSAKGHSQATSGIPLHD